MIRWLHQFASRLSEWRAARRAKAEFNWSRTERRGYNPPPLHDIVYPNQFAARFSEWRAARRAMAEFHWSRTERRGYNPPPLHKIVHPATLPPLPPKPKRD
jgi:hypothetical protein